MSFGGTQARYVGTNFISKLGIPLDFDGWRGKDITSSLNINYEETQFNFINDALGREFVNVTGQPLIFIVLDAGNFHHPKVCFTAAGYEIQELDDTEFRTTDRSFNVHTLFTKRAGGSFLSFYWIVIDKDIAHEWIEQKVKQLYFSILNKKRIGLMVRIDIPAKEDQIESAMNLARDFIVDISNSIPPGDAEYIFGKQ